MAERETERQREGEREEITSSRKNLLGKNFEFFFEIMSLFPCEMFSWISFFIPVKKLSLPKRLPNTFYDDMQKTFKNDQY